MEYKIKCIETELFHVDAAKNHKDEETIVLQTSAGNFAFSHDDSRELIVGIVRSLIKFNDPVAKDIAEKCLIVGENGET